MTDTDISTPYSFTDANLTDVFRFTGYPPQGTVINGIFLGQIINAQGILLYRLQHLSASEGAVVVKNYLTQLNQVETAIYAARNDMSVSQVATLKIDPFEMAKVRAEYRQLRLELCGFLGIPPGPALGGTRGHMVI